MAANSVVAPVITPAKVGQTVFVVRWRYVNHLKMFTYHETTLNLFKGLMWGSMAVSLCFVAFRAFIRLSVFRRLFWDDALVFAAWVMLLANVIIFHVVVGAMYLTLGIQSRVIYPPPPDFMSQVDLVLRTGFAVNFLNTCSLYAIKLSFMVIFLKLGHNVKGQKLLWRCVLAMVVAGLTISLAFYDWSCMVKPVDYEIGGFSL